MDQDATWYEGRPALGPGRIVLDRTQLPITSGTVPTFWSMSILAKRSPISATAEHLYNVVYVEAYLRTKLHLDPSNRLATIHQC